MLLMGQVRRERKEFAIKYPINIMAMCVAPPPLSFIM